MPYYVNLQNERKKGEITSTKLHRKSVADLRTEANPSSLPAALHLPCLLDQLVHKFGDFMLAEVHFFVLSWQKFTFTVSWATNTSMSLQFSTRFVCVFYISLRSHLLSQYHMLLICSKALKCNEKGIITFERRKCWPEIYNIKYHDTAESNSIAKAILLKLIASLSDRKKMLFSEVVFGQSWAAQCHYRNLRSPDNTVSMCRGKINF